MDNTIIGLVGAPGSGMSLYIASLVRELLRGQALANIGCVRFGPLDPTTGDRWYTQYYEPVFVHRSLLPRSVSHAPSQTRKPLVFEMLFNKQNPRAQPRQVTLAMFDSLDPCASDPAQLELFNRYVLGCSSLMCLLDPESIPELKQELPANLQTDKVPQLPRRDAFDVVEQLARIFRTEKRQGFSSPRRKPVCLSISKSDLLRFVMDGLTLDAPMLRNGDYSKGFDLADFESVSSEVGALLARLVGPTTLQMYKTDFPNMAFSAIAALGQPADQSGKLRLIAPRRCVDPLLWTLYRSKIIPAH